MNRKVKILLNVILLLALVGYAIVASVFYQDKEKRCEKFIVQIADTNTKFVDTTSVFQMVDTSGFNPVGFLRSQINVQKIEEIVKNNIYVDSVEVYTDMNATCVVKLTQRKPIIRINTTDGHDFYLTQNLVVLPPQQYKLHDVLIVNGDMPLDFDQEFYGDIEKKDGQVGRNLKKLLNFVQLISKDEFLNNLVVQIWVDKDWKIDLVPNVGNQVIRFGSLYDVQNKINKLTKFYKTRFGDGWWAFCKEVNVEYKNQIIIR